MRVGQRLSGFCAGYFGRDEYSEKVVEAVGPDWIVARGIVDNVPRFARGTTIHSDLEEVLNAERDQD